MKKLLLIFCLSILAIAQAMASQEDTIQIYKIDNQVIDHFTGKELEGKTIKSYEILQSSSPSRHIVIVCHRINTTAPNSPTNQEPHYIIEGKKGEITQEEMDKIPSSKIATISVLKSGSKAANDLSLKDDGRNYIIIKLKK